MPALFHELLFDPDIVEAGGLVGGPELANTMARNPQTGVYKINIGRYDFQQVCQLNIGLIKQSKLDYFMEFWGGGWGSGYGFRAMIQWDFYAIDEVLGTGNGVQTVFPLVKSYSRPGSSTVYTRRIVKPVTNTNVSGGVTLYEPDGVTTRTIPTARGVGAGVPNFTVKLNSTPTSAYTINNTTGNITMTSPPAGGVVVKASFEFDTPMRFMDNAPQIVPDVSSQIQALKMCEIMPAELGIT